MHGNAFFSIGKTHPICQDYACATMIGDSPLVLLADGCSSSPNTDVGARLLAHTAAKIFSRDTFPTTRDEARAALGAVIHQAVVHVEHLGLSSRCLDATLLISYVHNGELYILCKGDGAFVLQTKDLPPQYSQLFYPSGAPAYLSYWLNSERRAQYEKEYGIDYRMTDYLVDSQGEIVEPEEIPIEDDVYFTHCSAENCLCISLLSDGCESFEDTPPLEAMRELTAFKNYKGVFVERRVRRALKTYAKNNIAHHDDVSVASIYLES